MSEIKPSNFITFNLSKLWGDKYPSSPEQRTKLSNILDQNPDASEHTRITSTSSPEEIKAKTEERIKTSKKALSDLGMNFSSKTPDKNSPPKKRTLKLKKLKHKLKLLGIIPPFIAGIAVEKLSQDNVPNPYELTAYILEHQDQVNRWRRTFNFHTLSDYLNVLTYEKDETSNQQAIEILLEFITDYRDALFETAIMNYYIDKGFNCSVKDIQTFTDYSKIATGDQSINDFSRTNFCKAIIDAKKITQTTPEPNETSILYEKSHNKELDIRITNSLSPLFDLPMQLTQNPTPEETRKIIASFKEFYENYQVSYSPGSLSRAKKPSKYYSATFNPKEEPDFKEFENIIVDPDFNDPISNIPLQPLNDDTELEF